eukprot:TRINITY_DN45645_c0_g1_i1.p1 TRINITY_DN45645_c0_g1~~TRINITY_DN45645_c0_g1_i1.p1  ORF type:complete len:172 (+),score=21.65 TRINITY_DN45645_c0_g1_i1:124-639(+)
MIRRPPRSTLSSSSAASDVYKRQLLANGGTAPPVVSGDGTSSTCWYIPASSTEAVDVRGRICDPDDMVLDEEDSSSGDGGVPRYVSDQYQAGCCPPSSATTYPPVRPDGSNCFPTLPSCVSSCISTSRVGARSGVGWSVGIFHGCVVSCRHGPRSTVHQHEYRSPAHHCFS